MESNDVSSSIPSPAPIVPKKRRHEEFSTSNSVEPDTTDEVPIDLTKETASGLTTVAKKQSDDVTTTKKSEVEAFANFEGFSIKRVLLNTADSKRVFVEAAVGDNESAVVILDKKPFTDEIIRSLLTKDSALSRKFQNDVYGKYSCTPVPVACEIDTTVVYPATEKHIEKYLFRPLHLIIETPEIYRDITSPYLEKNSFDVQWVYNILEHKQEADRIVFEDADPANGFVLLPDLKWDGKTLENLYLVAIIHPRNIKSLRDLTADHLPLLENILKNGSKAIQEKYGLKSSGLRIYLHYQPSYYHLHIHFTALQYNAPGNFSEKSHILQSVISNLKNNTRHYQDAVLPFVVKEGDKHYNALKENGYQF